MKIFPNGILIDWDMKSEGISLVKRTFTRNVSIKGSRYIFFSFILHTLQPLTADCERVHAPIKPLSSAVCHSQFQAISKSVTSVITDFSAALSSYFHLMVSIFTSFYIPPVVFILSSLSLSVNYLILSYKSSHLILHLSWYQHQWEINIKAAHTSAAGMPSGGRHCNSTSCSRDTSFPRGSCSNDFFRSEEKDQERKNLMTTVGVREHTT